MLLKSSYLCFLAFIVSSFFSSTLRSIFLVIGLLLWLLDGLKAQSSKLKSNSLTLSLQPSALSLLDSCFIAYILVSLFLAFIHGVSALAWLKTLFVTYLQWFWIVSIYKVSNRNRDFVVLTIMACAALLSLIILLQLVGFIPHPLNAYGILGQPFTSSGLLLISLFVGLAYRDGIDRQQSTIRRVLILSLLMQTIAIIALGQLSTWAGLIIGFLVYSVASKKLTLKRFLITAIILLLSLFAINILSPRVAKKLQRLSSVEHMIASNSMQLRLQLWQQNYSAWLEKPMMGINQVVPYDNLTHVHNIYFQQLVEGGILKLIAWLSFYLAIGFYLLKNIEQGLAAYLGAYFAISIEGLLENWWGDAEVFSLFLIMVILASRYVPEENNI